MVGNHERDFALLVRPCIRPSFLAVPDHFPSEIEPHRLPPRLHDLGCAGSFAESNTHTSGHNGQHCPSAQLALLVVQSQKANL